jgi:hypothetical protein
MTAHGNAGSRGAAGGSEIDLTGKGRIGSDTNPTPTTTQGWRSVLKVHPAADMFPMMSDDELKALAKDIEANDLKSPITVWSPDPNFTRWRRRRGKRKPPPEFYLVDGRNRLTALEQCGRLEFNEAGWPSIEAGFDFDGAVTALGYGDDPYEYVVSANIHRRHLTSEQKRELIAKLLRATPDKSDRQIAATARVDHKTVGASRAEAEARGEIPHVENRTDTKGRTQPARKKRRPIVPESYITHEDGRRERFTPTKPVALFTACGMPANKVAETAVSAKALAEFKVAVDLWFAKMDDDAKRAAVEYAISVAGPRS